jgi:hypothetical protein
MSFKKTFCSSPWFHMRINNAGNYEFCRWAIKTDRTAEVSISTTAPSEYFQQHMAKVRDDIISGQSLDSCKDCYKMEKHGKISGRQRQLLKVGVRTDNFDKTLLSSPWIEEFNQSSNNLLPQDWQIDLGNFCNSGCVFCNPFASSKLAAEFKKLKIINTLPPRSWCDDPAQLDRFISTLKESPTVKYLHFLGGETLITPAFKKILKELVIHGVNKNVSIGFTTNVYAWDQETVDLLVKYKEVNLGVSVECFDSLNDYVRWPSNIATVEQTLDRWLAVAAEHNWLVQFRTTPTWLTVGRLLSVYDRALASNASVESCNFLDQPQHLRISVLPKNYRQPIVDQMKQWLSNHNLKYSTQIYNIRNSHTSKIQLIQDLASYVNYLENSEYQTELLPDAVQYLKLLESNRKNSVLDYLPEYEELLRSAGY